MSEWKISGINVELHKKTATVTAHKGGTYISVNHVKYDEPGQQTEAEIKKLALQAAKREIQDLLASLP